MQKIFTFTSHGIVGESGYISPTVEYNVHDDWNTRNEMLEHFQQFLVGVGYHFEENSKIVVITGE